MTRINIKKIRDYTTKVTIAKVTCFGSRPLKKTFAHRYPTQPPAPLAPAQIMNSFQPNNQQGDRDAGGMLKRISCNSHNPPSCRHCIRCRLTELLLFPLISKHNNLAKIWQLGKNPASRQNSGNLAKCWQSGKILAIWQNVRRN